MSVLLTPPITFGVTIISQGSVAVKVTCVTQILNSKYKRDNENGKDNIENVFARFYLQSSRHIEVYIDIATYEIKINKLVSASKIKDYHLILLYIYFVIS